MTAGARNTLEPSTSGYRPPGKELDTATTDSYGSLDRGRELVREQAQALALVAEALDGRELRAAATAVVTEIATALGAARVSLGILSNGRLELTGISNSAEFDRKSNLVRSIESAMQETCDLGSVVRYPDADSRLSCEAHAELARTSRSNALISIPLTAEDRVIGALILEYSGRSGIDDASLLWLSRVAMLLAPILYLKIRAEMPVRRRLARATSRSLKWLLGPHHLTLKVIGLLIGTAVMLLFMIDGTYRVTASAELEPSESHAVVAPVQGYIDNAFKRAGDIVSAGDRLASLDLRDLQLEQSKWQSELGKLGREYGAALATRDRNQQRILRSRQKQVNAQLELLETLMNRAELTAPIDGIVVSGDLTESFGSPVDRGELLFEVAPLESYRLILNVDERDIARIKEGQEGRLLLAGNPGAPIDFVVKRIMPISQAGDGANTFRVEAELVAEPDWIRPGMMGAAKVTVGEAPLAWIYTHSLTDAIELRWWQMGW